MPTSKQISRILFVLAMFLPWIAPPAQAQFETPAFCPIIVNPAVVGYPDNKVPYSEGGRSGIFRVNFLFDEDYVQYGARTAVTYIPDPETPRDVNNPRKVWHLAAFATRCIYWYLAPTEVPLLFVLEYWKGGLIYENESRSCDEEEDTTITGQFYEVIDLSTGSTARCGSGEDGQTPGAPMCYDLQLTPGCYAVYVDGVFRGNVCC